MAYFQPRAPDGGANGGIFWNKEMKDWLVFGISLAVTAIAITALMAAAGMIV